MVCLLLVAMFGVATTGFAYDPKQIDARVAEGLVEWNKVFANAEEVMDKADGTLICPRVSKVGLGVGVEKGNCALIVDGETVEYWRTSSASVGLTAGIQSLGQAIVFMTPEALEQFRSSDRGWKAGVDGSIAVARKGASGTMSTAGMNEPIMGWIYSTKGLMADLSFKGGTYKRIGTEADVAKFEDPFHRFVATANVEGRLKTGGAQTIQMTIDIDNWVTIAEIEGIQAMIREEGTADASMAIADMPAVGQIKQGGKVLPIQWARALQMGDDSYRVLLATSEPMGFSWAKQAENTLTIFQLDLDSKRLGTGVMQINPELGWDDKRNGITVKQQDIKPIELSSVSYKKIE
jgi:lipid-binding SYLF domain-containing protein